MGVSAGEISDISNHWAKEIIEKWIDSGLIGGYPDGTFKPNNSITRAEFMMLTNRAFNMAEEASNDFIDVPKNSWFFKEVAKALAAGYIGGYPDNTIRPNNTISRQEVAVILLRLNNLKEDLAPADMFNDAILIPEWSKGAIGAAAAAGYMGGYPDGSFKPYNNITRAEAVVVLNNTVISTPEMFDKAESSEIEKKTDNKAGNVIITTPPSGGQVSNPEPDPDPILGSEPAEILNRGTGGGMPTSEIKVKIDGSFINKYTLYFDGAPLASTSNGVVTTAAPVLNDLSRIHIFVDNTLRPVVDGGGW